MWTLMNSKSEWTPIYELTRTSELGPRAHVYSKCPGSNQFLQRVKEFLKHKLAVTLFQNK